MWAGPELHCRWLAWVRLISDPAYLYCLDGMFCINSRYPHGLGDAIHFATHLSPGRCLCLSHQLVRLIPVVHLSHNVRGKAREVSWPGWTVPWQKPLLPLWIWPSHSFIYPTCGPSPIHISSRNGRWSGGKVPQLSIFEMLSSMIILWLAWTCIAVRRPQQFALLSRPDIVGPPFLCFLSESYKHM